MATTELQAPYSSLEIGERESNGTAALEKKEPESRSKSQNEYLMSNARASNHKFSDLRNINWLRGVEIFFLGVIIMVVWILFSIPTIFYALPQELESSNSNVIMLL